MIRIFVGIICAALMVASCQQVEQQVPDTPQAHTTQSLVEKYIDANLNYDADSLMSLYSEDLFYMDYGIQAGPLTRGNLDYFVHETMSAKDFKLEFESYIITPDGRFAAIEALYSEQADLAKQWATTPALALLEFKDSQIISETWYYDGTKFH